MKKPSVPSRCGSVCRWKGTDGCCQTGSSAAQVVGLEVLSFGQEGVDHALVLGGRDRARRVHERAAGSERVGPRAQDRALRAREPLGLVGGLAPAGVGAAGERAEVGARRVDEHAVVGAAGSWARRRPRRGPSTQVAPILARGRAAARPRARGGARRPRARRGRPSARRDGSSCRRARRTGRARARRARGASRRATAIAARDCGMNRPSRHSGAPWASNGSIERPAPRAGRARARVSTGSRCASSAAAIRSVLARSAASAGSLSAAISARAVSAPNVLPPQPRDPLGVRVAQRGLLRCAVRERVDQRRRLARGAAQHRVDEPRAAPRLRLGELDRLPHRGVVGHAIEVDELEDPEPQRRDDGRLQAVERAAGERLDDVVQRGPALDGAVGEPGREGEVARVEPEPLGLAAERPIGPRAVLEHAAQDGERAMSGGGGHRTTVQTRLKGSSAAPRMPTKSVMGHSGRSTVHSSRARDLRFAGAVSAGMIATVVVLGALLAPVLAWNSGPAHNARDRSQTVRLPDLPKQGTLAAITPKTFAADRPGHRRVEDDPPRAAARRHRAGRRRAAEAAAPSRSAAAPSRLRSRTAPLATKSTDTDGDGMPDVWERRYGLDPDDATDATQDSDGDGLPNRTEVRTRTAPTRADSDRNGVADGDEDTDHDGLRNSRRGRGGRRPVAARHQRRRHRRRPRRPRRRRRPQYRGAGRGHRPRLEPGRAAGRGRGPGSGRAARPRRRRPGRRR